MVLKFIKTILGYKINLNFSIEKEKKFINTDNYDFIALDTESINGKGGIVSIGLAYFKDGKLVKTFYSLICPENTLEIPQAVEVCGIRYEDVKEEKHFPEVWELIKDDVCNYPIVGHSLGNDINQLKRIAGQCKSGFKLNSRGEDTHGLANKLLNLKKYSLTDVANALNIPHPNAHNSLGDAICTGKVFLELKKLKPVDKVQKEITIIAKEKEVISKRKTANTTFNNYGNHFNLENKGENDFEWYGKNCFIIGIFDEFTQDYLKEKLYNLGVNICKTFQVEKTDIVIYGKTDTLKKINKAKRHNLLLLSEKEIKERLEI